MGGLITTAARLNDGVKIHFRTWTNTNFTLLFEEKEFLKEMRRSCPSSHIYPKGRYNGYSRENAIKKYNSSKYGNNYFAPFEYGINFYDYKNKVAFSVNDYENNLALPAYKFVYDDIIKEAYQHKELYIFTDKDLDKLKNNISYYKLMNIEQFKKFKEMDALYDVHEKPLNLKDMDTLSAIFSIFDPDTHYVLPQYAFLKVKISEWQMYSGNDIKDFQFFHDYLRKEKLLTKNDELAWEMFFENRYG